MAEIKGVKIFKRGHNGVNIYTLHYKIMVEFKSGPAIKVLETQKREKVIKQVSYSSYNFCIVMLNKEFSWLLLFRR